MGDRYFISVTCPKCTYEEKEVYYAPTCGLTTWTCECGYVVDLEEYTGITEAEASNREEIAVLCASFDDTSADPNPAD